MILLEKTGGKISIKLGDEQLGLARVRGAVLFPGEHPGYLVVAGQGQAGMAYVLHEAQAPAWPDLAQAICQAVKALHMERVYYRDDEAGNAFRDLCNRMIREEGLLGLSSWGDYATAPFSPTPMHGLEGYNLALAAEWIRQQRLSVVGNCPALKSQLERSATMELTELVKAGPEYFAVKGLCDLLSGLATHGMKPVKAKDLYGAVSDERTGI